ncbi:MAG: photosystem II manganese-stabilizing polypeptide [Trichodesmium sp. St16_bin4-tuft]|nr:photosystem II manganese-stabilizing polypeptide [Trichodesmium sp. MAG_R01]MDE5069213.1 photosystem II manganese-stabilizing polypeptide [Trichodesmium sp. St4_bin8_1]MDE5073195.1 photosystem II manganese-stabilizing polypeptide [Trichodesmium sp. St5_bin8]MDE5078303.1 photosystem II manganese-stabilizing polypeptide [Trichodesmium sp. St2_bin6]MDE5091809.1 photosystem II manganese-stabilizing polypeptide [Trichodesmium sp. St18_bin3_1_1]MDE5101074.1 photosystem II manganese-stabilizing po
MKYRNLIALLLAVCLSVLTACSESPDSNKPLTYEDIVNTGLANNCPELPETARGFIAIDQSQSYTLTDLCLKPTTYFVKEEPTNKRQKAEFIQGKKLTRYTSTLDQITGELVFNEDNSLTFNEQYGIDFQAITILLPGGEEVPFLFTVKGLSAKSQPNITAINTSTDFQGLYNVPSYRGSSFLDPKGRGVTSGYDNAVALPASSDSQELVKANVKSAETLLKAGEMSLQITKVDGETGEIVGIFEAIQPSDTDLGAKEALEVKVRGNFYGRVDTDIIS